MYHNVERLVGRARGEYVGYGGGVWGIRRVRGGWTASRTDGGYLFTRTLRAMSAAIANTP